MAKNKGRTRTPKLVDEEDAIDPVVEETEEIGRDGEGQKPIEIVIVPVVCPRCKGTRRKPFKDGRDRVRDFESMQRDRSLGVFFNRIIFRRTECLDCGQKLIVRELTMKPEEED